jgi:hypothetical protein
LVAPNINNNGGDTTSEEVQSRLGTRTTSGDISSIAKLFWPWDLLALDFENARILTFGYESNPAGSSQNNLYTLSKLLLGRLTSERLNSVS